MLKRISLIRTAMLMTLAAGMITCAQKVEVSEDGIYGAGIKNERSADFKSLMAEMATKDTVETTFIATVSEVCQAKGCWMTLHDEQAGDVEIMVRFKDYGFFVPKDIGGRQVIVEGKAYRSVTPVEELRHYAEDAGKSPEEIAKITEPENTYSVEATGVKVLDKM
jgi:hypothetical protein